MCAVGNISSRYNLVSAVMFYWHAELHTGTVRCHTLRSDSNCGCVLGYGTVLNYLTCFDRKYWLHHQDGILLFIYDNTASKPISTKNPLPDVIHNQKSEITFKTSCYRQFGQVSYQKEGPSLRITSNSVFRTEISVLQNHCFHVALQIRSNLYFICLMHKCV